MRANFLNIFLKSVIISTFRCNLSLPVIYKSLHYQDIDWQDPCILPTESRVEHKDTGLCDFWCLDPVYGVSLLQFLFELSELSESSLCITRSNNRACRRLHYFEEDPKCLLWLWICFINSWCTEYVLNSSLVMEILWSPQKPSSITNSLFPPRNCFSTCSLDSNL